MFHRPHIARVAGEAPRPANDAAKRKRVPANREWASTALLKAARLEDGVLVWNERSGDDWGRPRDVKRFNTVHANTPIALKLAPSGYYKVRFFYGWFAAHRLVWACTHGAWPKGEIDHINGDRADNRIENLRDVPRAENNRNTARRSDNTSGATGVRIGCRGKWIAELVVSGKRHQVGTFQSREEAIVARKLASIQHGYGPHHGEAA